MFYKRFSIFGWKSLRPTWKIKVRTFQFRHLSIIYLVAKHFVTVGIWVITQLVRCEEISLHGRLASQSASLYLYLLKDTFKLKSQIVNRLVFFSNLKTSKCSFKNNRNKKAQILVSYHVFIYCETNKEKKRFRIITIKNNNNQLFTYLAI